MKIIFAGTPEFAIPALQSLLNSKHQICAVYTQPARPAGRGKKITQSAVAEFALANNLFLQQPTSLKDQIVQQHFKELNGDLLINVAYGLLVPKAILEAPRFGCVNIHPSLLPRWRGAAPIQRAILAGDTETGVTIMQMNEGLDTGGIYAQVKFPIDITDTSAVIMEKAARIGAELLLDVIKQIENNTAKITPQNDSLSTYAKKLNKEEAKIDWNLSAIEIDRLIRAFIPWPVAFTIINNENIRIWEAEAIDSDNITNTIPGTIIRAEKNGIDIATGKGILRLKKIQLPGGKPLLVKDVLNAHAKMFLLNASKKD